MTPLDFKALRAVAVADGYDRETLEFLDDLMAMAPAKTCEGVFSVSFGYEIEAAILLLRLMKKVLPQRSFTAPPQTVTLNDWVIMFVPGDLHVAGNLPLENAMVMVLGNLTVDGVVGSFRDFESTRLVVLGDLSAAGIECDKDVVVDGTVSADIIWLNGAQGIMMAKAVDARILYRGTDGAIEADSIRADRELSPSNPPTDAAMQNVLAPEAFTPEPGYVFEGRKDYTCVNRALRLMQLGRPGLLHH